MGEGIVFVVIVFVVGSVLGRNAVGTEVKGLLVGVGVGSDNGEKYDDDDNGGFIKLATITGYYKGRILRISEVRGGYSLEAVGVVKYTST